MIKNYLFLIVLLEEEDIQKTPGKKGTQGLSRKKSVLQYEGKVLTPQNINPLLSRASGPALTGSYAGQKTGYTIELVTDSGTNVHAQVFAWWLLCLIYASLRYDDGIHVRTNSLAVRERTLHGHSWQTKTSQKTREAVAFAIPDTCLKHKWLLPGWAKFQWLLPGGRDFWVPRLTTEANGSIAFRTDEVPTFETSLTALRAFLHMHVVAPSAGLELREIRPAMVAVPTTMVTSLRSASPSMSSGRATAIAAPLTDTSTSEASTTRSIRRRRSRERTSRWIWHGRTISY